MVNVSVPVVILDGREEFQIAAMGRPQQLPKGGKAIDRLLHGRVFLFLRPIPMSYLAAVLEKGDAIDRGLDAQDQPTKLNAGQFAVYCAVS